VNGQPHVYVVTSDSALYHILILSLQERGLGGATLEDPPIDTPTFSRFYGPNVAIGSHQQAARQASRGGKRSTDGQNDTVAAGAVTGLVEAATQLVMQVANRNNTPSHLAAHSSLADISFSQGPLFLDVETFLDHLEADEVKVWKDKARQWGRFAAKFKEIGVLHVGELTSWTAEQLVAHVGMEFGYAMAFVKAIRSEAQRVRKERANAAAEAAPNDQDM